MSPMAVALFLSCFRGLQLACRTVIPVSLSERTLTARRLEERTDSDGCGRTAWMETAFPVTLCTPGCSSPRCRPAAGNRSGSVRSRTERRPHCPAIEHDIMRRSSRTSGRGISYALFSSSPALFVAARWTLRAVPGPSAETVQSVRKLPEIRPPSALRPQGY